MSRSLSFAFGSILSGRLLAVIITAGTTPLLTRLLGASGYGQYATVIAVIGLVKILTSSGITSGAQKFLGENRSIEGWKEHVWGYYWRLAGVLVLPFAIGLALSAYTGLVENVFGPDYTNYFYLLAVVLLSSQYRGYVRRALMGLHLEKFSEPLRVAHKVFFAVFAVGLVYFEYGVIGALAGKILANVLIIGLGILMIRQHVSLKSIFNRTPDSFPDRELLSFNNASIVYIFLLTTLYQVDILMLQTAVGDTKVGYYKAALVIAELLWIVPRALQQVFLHSLSDLWRTGEISQINEIATNTTRYVMLFSLLCAVGLVALADEFVPLYFGQEYTPAVTPLLILLPGTIGFAIARPLLSITQSKGQMRPLIIATGISALLNLILNAALIPIYEMNGAAIATTIGYGSLPISQFACARYIGYQPLNIGVIARSLATVALSTPVIILLGQHLDGLLSLFVVPPVGGIVFLVTALLTRAVPFEDVKKAKNQVVGIIAI